MISISPYQVFVPLAAFVLVLYAWSLVLRQKKTIWEGVLWTLFWGAVGYIALFPSEMRYLSEFTGIKRNETAVLVTSIGVLFFIVFYIVVRMEALSQRITKMVQNEALKNAGLSKRKEKQHR